MANEIIPGFAQLGGAVTALFGAKGAIASATSYEEAAAIAAQNAKLAKEAAAITDAQQQRQVFQTIGAQRAGIAGAGFAESGTAIDLLRSSASQGALTHALTAVNGAIQENSYAVQAGMYSGLAGAAKSTAKSETISGVLQGISGAANLASGLYTGYKAITGAGGILGAAEVGGGGAFVGDLPTVFDAAGSAAGATAGAEAGAASAVPGFSFNPGMMGPAAIAAVAASIVLEDMFSGDPSEQHRAQIQANLDKMGMTPDQYAKYVVDQNIALPGSQTLEGGYDYVTARGMYMLGFNVSDELKLKIDTLDTNAEKARERANSGY